MKKLLLLAITIGGLFGTGLSAQSADPLAEKEFSPSGRLSNGSIKGTLTRTEGEYYFIKGLDGIEKKIHVDKNTKYTYFAFSKRAVRDTAEASQLGHIASQGHRLLANQIPNPHDKSG